VTKNVSQIKNVIIYGQVMSDNSINVVMGGSSILQIINFFSLTLKQKGIFTQTLPVKISFVIVNKVTGKLPHTFMLERLIIPFDRGREYC